MNIKNILFVCIVLFISHCSHSPQISSLQISEDINVSQLLEMITTNQNNQNFIIIDIRSPKDFNKSHLSSAMNINFRAPDFSQQINALQKNKTYVIYCYIGGSSKYTLKKMQKMKFKEVYNLKGGFTNWNKQNLPVVKHK